MSRAVAIDLGQRRIGVAVSDHSGTMAFPRPMIERHRDRSADHRAILAVVAEAEADVLVIGLPLSLDGGHGPAAQGTEVEAGQLASVLAADPTTEQVRVETFDERFTTVSASAALAAAGKRGSEQRQSVDSAAAAVLLQAWLESR